MDSLPAATLVTLFLLALLVGWILRGKRTL
jgi:hypothetical protein